MHVEDEIQRAPGLPAARPHRVAPTHEVKAARRLLWLLPTVVIVLLVGSRLIITSEYVSREIAGYIAGELANRTRADVQLSGVTFGLDYAPCFQNFEIYRVSGGYKVKASTEQACVERWASAVGSGFHAIRLRLQRPSIAFEGEQGAKRVSPFVDAKPTKEASKQAAARAALREIQVVFDDLRLTWDTMPVPDRFARGSFGPIDGTVTLQMRGGKTAATLAIREPSSGSTINGRINPTEAGWDMSAGVEGDLVSIFGSVLEAADLDIRKMPTHGRIGALYKPKERDVTLDLDLEQSNIDLASNLVSATRLTGFSAREQARFEIDLDKSLLEVKSGLLEVNGIPVVLSLKVAPGQGSAAFDFHADLQTTPFLRLIRSVPGAQEPVLTKELSPNVKFALSFAISGALRDPSTWQPKLEHRMTGIGPHGEGSGLELLKGAFRYYPLTREGRSPVAKVMGPGSPNWTPFEKIPYLQRRAIAVSEDASFFVHHGIDIDEIKNAIHQGLTSSEKAQRGGSSITQQLVKNLFLTRDRTALRKLQEALLTFHLESSLKKEQILEMYINIIEWGPDIYGIKEAAEHYFGKRPDELAIREMVYLTMIIPSPIPSHEHYETGHIPAKTNAKIDFLLERLNRLGSISNQQLADAKAYKIRFARPKPTGETKEKKP